VSESSAQEHLANLNGEKWDYGVVINAGAVDAGATARRRAELRAARGWATPPA
jgi:hypothetical protein